MDRTCTKQALTIAIVFILSTPSVWATNGLAPIGVGIDHRAMGGAGAGNPLNTTSLGSNPASASFVNDGYDIGVEFFKPDRKATFKGTAYGAPMDMTADGNGKDLFAIPEGGYKRKVNPQVDAGIVVYGNGGMNTSYDKGVPFGMAYFSGQTAQKTGVDLQQLFVAPTVSYKFNDKAAVGISANLVYQKFKAEGLGAFTAPGYSVAPNNLTDKGYDESTGVGATVGLQGKVTPRLTAGIAYRSKVSMGKLDKYKGLFPNGGEFDVPAATSMGVAYQANPQTVIAADVQKINYSDIAAIGNSSRIPAQFGSNNGPGFGWSDQTIYKIGVRHQVNNSLALMAGYNKGDTPVSTSETTLNVLAPATVEQHITLGLEKKLNPKAKFNVGYTHALEKTVKGNATMPAAGQIPLDAYDITMKQNAIDIGYSVEF